MGIVITAAATAAPTDLANPTDQASPTAPATSASAVDLAGRAARSCLDSARVSPSGVGVLVNVGVYREHNTFEPAVSALVQKEVGINLDYLADPQPAAGFSFDLMNGACGVLSAVQTAQALLATGTTERLLITAADVHPGGNASHDPDYPYADLAGAVLLERAADPGTGFGPVRHYGADRPTDVEGYLDLDTMGSSGRSGITVRRTPQHETRTGELAAAAVASYAEEFGLDLTRTLLIGPRVPLDPAAPPGTGGEPHTAAPILGYVRALEAGVRPADYDGILFVTAGAGPSAACASYRPQGW
ncbi:hypothetical protein ACFVGY_13285 [Streptomyces sp. NPDC127106]|uniref:hypothetical protein n=1 Tax=Streptomyces sp. NPDC127106 TaxID=3345360 RepID=UPI00363D219F